MQNFESPFDDPLAVEASASVSDEGETRLGRIGGLGLRAHGDSSTTAPGGRSQHSRQQRWKQVMEQGVSKFMVERPDVFRRRVRRGIPTEYRWDVWKAAARTEERAQPGRYQRLLEVENQWTRPIEIDIPRTFPEMPLFDKEQQQSLLRILHAYANLNPDVGYCQGMNFVAGLLMLVCQHEDFRQTPRLEKEEETFWMFVCLMEDRRLSGFYKRRFPLLRRFLWAFDELVKVALPDLRDHFQRENVQHAVYLHQWFLTLFINCLPLPMVLVFWDVMVCIGLDTLLPITVSLLRELKDVLLNMQFEDIVRFFKTMRMSEPDCDPASIGTMVVYQSDRIDMPLRIINMLRHTDPLAGDDSAPNFEGDESDCSEGFDETPPSSPGPPWDYVHGMPGPCSGDTALEPSEQESASARSHFRGYLSQQLSDLGRDWPQGMLTWWEDARDNLQRVGLGVPASREGTQPGVGVTQDGGGEHPCG